ncbi:MAG TPA: SGNH hydrolase domain-containing protein, partial [Polyangia bacterium]
SPIPGVRYLPFDETRAECPAFNDAVLRAVLAEKDARVVVLAGRWDVYATGNLLLTLDGEQPSIEASRQLFVSSLRKLLSTLADSGRHVILVGQVPLPPPEAVVCVGRARFRGLDENRCAIDESRERARTESLVNQLLLEAVFHLESSVQTVHPYELLCPNHHCMVQADGQLLYVDESHLSSNGARLLESSLEKGITAASIAAKRP